MLDVLQLLVLLLILYMLWHQYGGDLLPRVTKGRKVILDSCALIDGRIVEITKAGFVPEKLIIPEFIVHELQLLADGTDTHKRARARFGLDTVQVLQQQEGLSVVVDKTKIIDKHAIDDKLIVLAKKLDAPLYTTDYNLGKVAAIEGVKVLNVNELAQHLRPVTLPGEIRSVKVLQKGSNPKQGIGYMEDGTMIVVEGGARAVGDLVEVEITKTHQTAAGKMLFGELAHKRADRPKPTAAPRLAARRPNRTKPSVVSHMKRKVS